METNSTLVVDLFDVTSRKNLIARKKSALPKFVRWSAA